VRSVHQNLTSPGARDVSLSKAIVLPWAKLYEVGARIVYAVTLMLCGLLLLGSWWSVLLVILDNGYLLDLYAPYDTPASQRAVFQISFDSMIVPLVVACAAVCILFVLPSSSRRRIRWPFFVSILTFLISAKMTESMVNMFHAKHDHRNVIEYVYPSFHDIRSSMSPLKKAVFLPLVNATEAGQGTSALFLGYAFLWALVLTGLVYLCQKTLRRLHQSKQQILPEMTNVTPRINPEESNAHSNIGAAVLFLSILGLIHSMSVAASQPYTAHITSTSTLVQEWKSLNAMNLYYGMRSFLTGASLALPWGLLVLPRNILVRFKWWLSWAISSQVFCSLTLFVMLALLQQRSVANPADMSGILGGATLLVTLYLAPLLLLVKAGLGTFSLILHSALLGLLATSVLRVGLRVWCKLRETQTPVSASPQ
jgi:hypothetical protein